MIKKVIELIIILFVFYFMLGCASTPLTNGGEENAWNPGFEDTN